MNATEIVAKWQHLDTKLTPGLKHPDYDILHELWQAAKLGAVAEAELITLRAKFAAYVAKTAPIPPAPCAADPGAAARMRAPTRERIEAPDQRHIARAETNRKG